MVPRSKRRLAWEGGIRCCDYSVDSVRSDAGYFEGPKEEYFCPEVSGSGIQGSHSPGELALVRLPLK